MSKWMEILRKLWRRNKGLVTLGTFFIVLLLVNMLQMAEQNAGHVHQESIDPTTNEQTQDSIAAMNKNEWSIYLVSEYLCGVQTEVKIFQSVEDMEAWLIQNQGDWDRVVRKAGSFTLYRHVPNDLSPICKAEGYFGLTDDYVLSIFEGPPSENKIIQTFFRIDTELLESKIDLEELLTLRQGIRIYSVEDYLHVLSTFEQYATEY